MQIESKENIIDKFCNSIWIERGLSSHTIESYKRDLLQYDLWLNEKSKRLLMHHRQILISIVLEKWMLDYRLHL